MKSRELLKSWNEERCVCSLHFVYSIVHLCIVHIVRDFRCDDMSTNGSKCNNVIVNIAFACAFAYK